MEYHCSYLDAFDCLQMFMHKESDNSKVAVGIKKSQSNVSDDLCARGCCNTRFV